MTNESPNEDRPNEDELIEFDFGFGKIRIGGSFPGMDQLKEFARRIEEEGIDGLEGSFEELEANEGQGKIFGIHFGPLQADPETMQKFQDFLSNQMGDSVDMGEMFDCDPSAPNSSRPKPNDLHTTLTKAECGALHVEADLPGIRQQDLLIALEGDRLYIRAQTGHRSYRKTLELPDGPWGEFEQTFENGVLGLRITPAD